MPRQPPLWLLPVMLLALNVTAILLTFFLEGRLKVNCVRYALGYLFAIRPAMKGDLTPLFETLQIP